jgi:dethiobiotin synthetase
VRPSTLIVVTGTATEIGKTWITAALARRARDHRITVSARKPVQSFTLPQADPSAADAQLLAAATGETPEIVCPPNRSYPLAMAPPMAAIALGIQPPTLADLVCEISQSWPSHPVGIGLVEGAGGVASPIATDGHTADLARALRADTAILVANADLGTINSVRLCHAALTPIPVVVHLNHYNPDDDLHRRNHHWLRHHDKLTLTTTTDQLLETVMHHHSQGRHLGHSP